MITEQKYNQLKINGFQIIDIKKIESIIKIRKRILKITLFELKKNKINYKFENENFFFNYFHNIKIEDSLLNKIRINIINKINKDQLLIEKFYKIFFKEISSLLGNDIIGQKNINLVIQKPMDRSIAPIHRDSPPNSPYEIVFWLPLVDCYGTKSISFLNKKFTKKVEKILLDKRCSYTFFENFFKKKSKSIKCQFGQVVIFQTPVFHYIPINHEKETRFSLNFRFKNLNTKYGSKTFPEYFKTIKISNKTKKNINK